MITEDSPIYLPSTSFLGFIMSMFDKFIESDGHLGKGDVVLIKGDTIVVWSIPNQRYESYHEVIYGDRAGFVPKEIVTPMLQNSYSVKNNEVAIYESSIKEVNYSFSKEGKWVTEKRLEFKATDEIVDYFEEGTILNVITRLETSVTNFFTIESAYINEDGLWLYYDSGKNRFYCFQHEDKYYHINANDVIVKKVLPLGYRDFDFNTLNGNFS